MRTKNKNRMLEAHHRKLEAAQIIIPRQLDLRPPSLSLENMNATVRLQEAMERGARMLHADPPRVPKEAGLGVTLRPPPKPEWIEWAQDCTYLSAEELSMEAVSTADINCALQVLPRISWNHQTPLSDDDLIMAQATGAGYRLLAAATRLSMMASYNELYMVVDPFEDWAIMIDGIFVSRSWLLHESFYRGGHGPDDYTKRCELAYISRVGRHYARENESDVYIPLMNRNEVHTMTIEHFWSERGYEVVPRKERLPDQIPEGLEDELFDGRIKCPPTNEFEENRLSEAISFMAWFNWAENSLRYQSARKEAGRFKRSNKPKQKL